jgi:hypothetical protein
MPSAVISELLKAGVHALLIFAAIELALLILAFGIGIGVWFAKGLLSGIVAGIATFVIAQALVFLIIDMTPLFGEPPQESSPEPSNEEVLAELRKELTSSAENVMQGDRR